MTLTRVTTTHRALTREAAERARDAVHEPVRRVEALEGVEADRQRSLQQELDEVQAKATGPFEGEEQILQNARDVAEKLTQLGPEAADLVRPDKCPKSCAVDAEA